MTRSFDTGVHPSRMPGLVAAMLTVGLLSIAKVKAPLALLLADRFVPGAGWLQVALLGLYAGFMTGKLLETCRSALWRRRIWGIFSVVFFTQLVFGLFYDRFLMTGELHLPVPLMIAAGPLYRAERFFMPILFTATVLLVGPAWCSFLCYIGAWDSRAAQYRRFAAELPRWRHAVRVSILVVTLSAAVGLRFLGASTTVATALAATFGLGGVLVMLLWSRVTGSMAHCVTYCPIGLLANLLGRINPFRIRIDESCTSCGACTKVCRYDALGPEQVEQRRPGFSCTLCGDCVGACGHDSITYRFFFFRGERVRTCFTVIAVSLNAVFLGVARI